MASHPLQAIGEAVGAAGADPRPMQLSSLFQGANDGPAKTAAKLTGVQAAGKRADDGPYFTNNEAIPFPDPAHSKTAGGIPVASDTFLFQKQQHFDRSKPLERMVHPCGSGAFGYFETTKDVSSLTKAHFLRSVGVRTPVFARFSTVTLGREFPDEARNPRGFAVKFYTGEGNYDIVGLNFPVFFCRDPIQGPDVIRSQYRIPQNFLLDHNSLFDLLANTPEGNHAGMMFFSDHGTPVGWRNLRLTKGENLCISNTNFIADRGQKQSTADEAIQMCGEDPDFSKRDLYQAIEKGEKISWTAHVQIMKPEEADPTKLGFDPFDVTKLHEFGKLVLNKNPENFHRDVEQAAFSPGSMVPGIEDSPDPLLQFRMFFYRDAQYHRIGVNLHQIPVNCPFMASSYSSLNFDGPLRVDANHAMNPQYAPNSFVHKFRPDTAEAPYQLADNTVSRKSHFYHEGKLSEYDQPRALYQKVMDARGREHLHCNTARMLKVVEYPEIQLRYLTQLYCIAPEYARGVYDLLPEQKFDFSQVKAQAQGAERVGKEAKFRPSKDTDILAGKCPATPVYNQ
ncbi:hypothetical protein KXV95_003185 [Aspergillus fumigatus]|nr:hypothetical protein CNMCM8812_003474 [Aspergillus fumigatus]KAH1334710.1 hypothetical protein KXX67_005671 [Aspergillus fumigatus]KAH1443878.1 hypothetical protein KXX13_005881 [Aspergillus fumigatus]KAH1595392.1 hypothetical protein KXX44_007146 [Aspergillus fumigatus]KAH1635828.1 hypothetical protein KXX39_007787 [Aspergillus fumigatus]